MQVLLRGESPLSQSERELIAAYVSHLNDCMFYRNSHAAAARCLFDEEKDVVDDVLADMYQADISDRLKAILRIAGSVQILGKKVTPADIGLARALGVSDREIHDTVLIAATFSMLNRYVDGLATFTPTDPEVYEDMGKRMTTVGYVFPQKAE